MNSNSLPAIELVDLGALVSHPDNPRTHSRDQISRLAKSIEAFGFRQPVIVDGQNRLICGHARVEACKKLQRTKVPAIRADDLTEEQIRAYMIADNRLSELSEWDDDLLAQHLGDLDSFDLDFDIESTGFDYGDIEQRISGLGSEPDPDDEADALPEPLDPERPICTRPGDLWLLGADREWSQGASDNHEHGHRICCGNSLDRISYKEIIGEERVALVFTDPPYNLPARSIGSVAEQRHGDFKHAAGEMSPSEFTDFLSTVMKNLVRFSRDGSIHYLCMDWRHMQEMLTAGSANYTELKNLCVWAKDRPGMGCFYRSQHELIFVYKNGASKHQNNFELGQNGRTRTNVWHYKSARSFDADDGDPESSEVLSMHPTIKPVRMIEDALIDCSRRGDTVLDPFLGSGSTLIACEKQNRRCRGIELEPRYVDTAILRWQELTGLDARHSQTDKTFFETLSERAQTEMENDHE